MVKNFESLTHELTENEEQIITYITPSLVSRRGAQSAINNAFICRQVNDRIKSREYKAIEETFVLTDVRLRKIIHEIRVRNIIPLLVSNSKGYFVAQTEEEVEATIDSMEQRARSMFAVSNILKEQYGQVYQTNYNERHNTTDTRIPYVEGLAHLEE